MSTQNTNRLAAKQGIGMDLAGLSDLASMLDAPVVDQSKPRMFDRERIHEDLNNTRQADNPGFSKESIAELAQSIKDRGIKSPLSFRSHPDIQGDYIINHGHRRFRASGVAGCSQVPGFLDEAFDQYDQMIENIQRENLSAREIADFIGQELSKGKSQADIGRLLGMSKAFISQHAALLNLPDSVADAFHAGQVKDVTLANELARAHKENPKAVEQILATQDGGLAAKQITRATVKALRKKDTTPLQNKKPPKPNENSEFMSIAKSVSGYLNTTVSINEKKGSEEAELIIQAQDVEHLKHLITRLGMGSLLTESV